MQSLNLMSGAFGGGGGRRWRRRYDASQRDLVEGVQRGGGFGGGFRTAAE
jgi:hypothetical protein